MSKLTPAQEKQQVIEQMLTAESMHIHLDAREDSVSVPKHLKTDSNLSLKLSYHFAGALELGEDTIHAELTFQGKLVSCLVPYSAIWGATDFSGQTKIWPESVPPAVLAQLLASAEDHKTTEDEDSVVEENTKPHLKRIK